MNPSLRTLGAALLTTVIGVALGAAIVLDLQLGFALWVALLGLIALTGQASVWAGAALIAALTFKGLATMNVLPEIAIYLDIPLAWGALLAASLRGRRDVLRSHPLLFFFGLLVFAVVASYLAHPSEPLRPVLYLALLGEPFALIMALHLDPPSPRMRKALIGIMAALVVVQLPVALFQATKFGTEVRAGTIDPIQGTLYGSGAGAHVFSAVVILGCLWWLSGRAASFPLRFMLAIPYLFLPFMADAKQVIFAVPAVLLVGGWKNGAWPFILRAVVVLLLLNQVLGSSNSDVSIKYLEQNREGQGGKSAVASLLWDQLTSDPASFAVGKGPAETVSRSAFMTTYLFTREDSAIAKLGLHQAEIAIHAQALATQVSGGGSSFNSATSSMLGVLGDLGIVGATAYAGLLATIMLSLRRRRSSLASASLGAWGIFIVLGLVYDWWEQPPFGVFLAMMTALALTDPSDQPETEPALRWRATASPPAFSHRTIRRPLPGAGALGVRHEAR